MDIRAEALKKHYTSVSLWLGMSSTNGGVGYIGNPVGDKETFVGKAGGVVFDNTTNIVANPYPVATMCKFTISIDEFIGLLSDDGTWFYIVNFVPSVFEVLYFGDIIFE